MTTTSRQDLDRKYAEAKKKTEREGGGCLTYMDPEEYWMVWTRDRSDGGQEVLAQHAGCFSSPLNRRFWAKLTLLPDGSHNGWTASDDGPAQLAEGGWIEQDLWRCYSLVSFACEGGTRL